MKIKTVIETLIILSILSAYTLVVLDVLIETGRQAEQAKKQIYGKAERQELLFPKASSVITAQAKSYPMSDLDNNTFVPSGEGEHWEHLRYNDSLKLSALDEGASPPTPLENEQYLLNYTALVNCFITSMQIITIHKTYSMAGYWLYYNFTILDQLDNILVSKAVNVTSSSDADYVLHEYSFPIVMNMSDITMLKLNISVASNGRSEIDFNQIYLEANGVMALEEVITVTETVTVTREKTHHKKVYIDPTVADFLMAYGTYLGMIIAGTIIATFEYAKGKNKKPKRKSKSILNKLL
jgi:hypothetical protein